MIAADTSLTVLTRVTYDSADLDGLPDNLKQTVRDANLEVVDYLLTLDYSYWPADHVLKVWRLVNLVRFLRKFVKAHAFPPRCSCKLRTVP